MLVPDKPKRAVSQAPIKFTTCLSGCGAEVAYRTNPRVYCPPCKLARGRADARLSMERQRRKRGVPVVKGSKIVCAACGVDVVLSRNADAKFCKPCGLNNNAIEARERSAKKRATVEGRKYHNAWLKQRRRVDPRVGIKDHMRVMFHRALGSRKAGKSWRDFVPYSLEELMAHLERQFLPGMTWKNRGEWHVDHVVALSRFDLVDPQSFKAAFALSNLRPLWGVDNIRKNATRTHLI